MQRANQLARTHDEGKSGVGDKEAIAGNTGPATLEVIDALASSRIREKMGIVVLTSTQTRLSHLKAQQNPEIGPGAKPPSNPAPARLLSGL